MRRFDRARFSAMVRLVGPTVRHRSGYCRIPKSDDARIAIKGQYIPRGADLQALGPELPIFSLPAHHIAMCSEHTPPGGRRHERLVPISAHVEHDQPPGTRPVRLRTARKRYRQRQRSKPLPAMVGQASDSRPSTACARLEFGCCALHAGHASACPPAVAVSDPTDSRGRGTPPPHHLVSVAYDALWMYRASPSSRSKDDCTPTRPGPTTRSHR